MRRLVKQLRNDKYISKKDYQTLLEETVKRIVFQDDGKNISSFVTLITTGAGMVGMGAFIFPDRAGYLTVKVLQEDEPIQLKRFSLSENWNRIGLSWMKIEKPLNTLVVLEFEAVKSIDIWGMNCEPFNMRDITSFSGSDIELLSFINQEHLSPETFYINHNNKNSLKLKKEISSSLTVITVSERKIIVKKCCYCQRNLPVNSLKNLSSFHKHAAKRTGFQNECRACKKWRINDTFNPDRTKDQLHESSVITREKKVLLREPEALKEIKNRYSGEGLKTITWKKFDRRCFNCDKELTLAEMRLDHTRPLAYLWPLDEHATCLCEKCNNSKHDEFPVNFYNSEEKLRKLSEITKLPYEDLIVKDVNEVELKRIMADIVGFAKELDPRTFRSIANKVKEMRPEIDLFEFLKKSNIIVYMELTTMLEERPADSLFN